MRDPVKVAEAFLAAWSRLDPDELASFFAEDAVVLFGFIEAEGQNVGRPIDVSKLTIQVANTGVGRKDEIDYAFLPRRFCFDNQFKQSLEAYRRHGD